VLIDSFLEDAFEADVDAIADGTRCVIGGVMQHIEDAGIHSGDSACVLPPYLIADQQVEEMRHYTRAFAERLGVVGLLNVQFAIKNGVVYVLEVNPRASRTVPFVSKTTGVPLASLAAAVMVGKTLEELGLPDDVLQPYVAVKEAVFPFSKLQGVDLILGPEMRSTGEVMGVADNFGEAFAKAQLSAGQKLPTQGTLFISVNEQDKPNVADVAQRFVDMGFKLVATNGTADLIEAAGMNVERVFKVKEGRPNAVDLIKGDRIHLIVNTPHGPDPYFDEKAIRRAAVQGRIPTITTLAAARAAAEGIAALQRGEVKVQALQKLHAERVNIRT
jgi:carbamoyl-phosphate synthase large subunit